MTDILYDEDGRVLMTPTPAYAKLKELRRRQEAAAMLPHDEDGCIIIQSRASYQPHLMKLDEQSAKEQEDKKDKKDKKEKNEKKGKKDKKNKKTKEKKQKNKKKSKKKAKKDSKSYKNNSLKIKCHHKREKELTELQQDHIEEKKASVPSITAELVAAKGDVCVHDNEMYTYDKDEGYFIKKDKQSAKIQLMGMFDKNGRLKTSPRDIDQIYQSILINPDLQRDLSLRVNIPLVNCQNGVLNIDNMVLLKHDPQYGFTYCINANYDDKAVGNVTRSFLEDITNGNSDDMIMIQEVVGYLFSGYVYAKKAFLFFGVPNSGKSLLLYVIGCIMGSDNVCHITIQQLEDPRYISQLSHYLLSIAPDVPQTPIKDIGIFKSAVSSLDMIEAKELYKNPVSQNCYCELVFGANHYIPPRQIG